MNSSREENFELLPESCRLCLDLKKEIRCLLIRSKRNDDLIKMLNYVMQLELKIELDLPCCLCQSCEDQLVKAYSFLRMCHESNRRVSSYKSKRKCLEEEVKMKIQINENEPGPSDCHNITADTKIYEIKSEYSEDLQNTECDTSIGNEEYVLENANNQELEKDSIMIVDTTIKDNGEPLKQDFNNIKVLPNTFSKKTGNIDKKNQPQEITPNLKPDASLQVSQNARKLQKSFATKVQKGRKKSKRELCTKCNKYTNNLQKHNATRHESTTARIFEECMKGGSPTCKICGKHFKNNNTLKGHIKLKHTEEFPFKCRFCNLRTQSAPALARHETQHTGEKSFICHFCGKAFPGKNNLITHLPQHTGKKFICEICGKACVRSSHLKIHMTQHTGEFRFSCTYCEKKFYMNKPYQDHLRTHITERPFKCEICGKAFKHKKILKRHVGLHSESKPLQCILCPYACWEPYRMRLHKKVHDKEIGEDIPTDTSSQ